MKSALGWPQCCSSCLSRSSYRRNTSGPGLWVATMAILGTIGWAQRNPFLRGFSTADKHRLLRAFAMAVHNGQFSWDFQHPLAESTVCNAISHVAKTFQDHGKQNPTKYEDGKTGWLLQCPYHCLKNSYPNRTQQKALPVCVLCELAKQEFSKEGIAIKQLAIGDFFFACCSYKCLLVPVAQHWRMTMLTLGKIQGWILNTRTLMQQIVSNWHSYSRKKTRSSTPSASWYPGTWSFVQYDNGLS